MLTRLTIRDFVLVERLELEFDRGFGALTGETGAGKSILVDALAFVLGERADSSLVRAGAERAEISAEFDLAALPAASAWLSAQDLDASDGLFLRRVVDSGGRSRAYVCGTPITLQQLREISDLLVDIHGQHAHQSLLRADAQRAMVDAYGGLLPQAAAVAAAWRAWREARERWQNTLAGGEALAREREQLAWEIDELNVLGFSADEWEPLNEEQRRLAHAASLAEGAEYALQGLSDGEGGCAAQLAGIAHRLEQLIAFDSRLEEIAGLVRSAEVEVGEAAGALRRYADRVELDPNRLAEVDRRIHAVLALARKFRVAPEELPAVLRSRQERLAELGEGSDPARLQEAAEKAEAAYRKAAATLSRERKKTAGKLSELVSARMHELALGGGRFEVALVPVDEGSAGGLEKIEFRVAGLAGGEARPLAKVASGGELSRISLALQVVASHATQVPTLIFDEVDVGIGGGVAEVVGRLLRELGRERQVLCVTHLPQVAARANWQWRVVKHKQGERFASEVLPLDAGARVEEIARMLGGVEITTLTREHAREMLGAA